MKANETMSTHLPSNFDSSRLSHAYISPHSLADSLAMAAVCSGNGKKPCMVCSHCLKTQRGIHPDIATIKKPAKKRDIIVDQIRELKRDVIIVPNEAEKKVYIIDNAHLMNGNAQNAFLRILEEPPSHTVFILKTDTPAELLPTVRSRCIELKAIIQDKPRDDLTSETVNEFFTALKHGNAALIEFMFRMEKLKKDQLADFLISARERTVKELKSTAADKNPEIRMLLSRTEQALIKAGEYLDFNVSAGHISGMICATLIGGHNID